MNLPLDGHAQFHELISARLDADLAADEEWELSEHLAECPPCRSVSRDYRVQRSLVASLPMPPPPRDLWARTSAALDRAMADAPRASDRDGARHAGPAATRSAPGSRWLGLTAITSVLLAGAVMVTQMNGNLSSTANPSRLAARATPFDVTPQDLAVFDFTAHGVSVYQARVSEACPPPSIDCASLQLPTLPVLRISGNSAANRGVAVNTRSGRLALVAGNADGADTVSVVNLPPYRADPSTLPQGPTPVGTAEPPATPQPIGTGLAASQAPAPTPTLTPAPTTTPEPSQTAAPTQSGPQSSPIDTPAPNTQKPDKTHQPTARPSQPATTDAPTPSPVPSASQDPGPSKDPAATPADPAANPTPDPNATQQPAEVALSIVDGVHLVGAPVTWSIDGSMLAFSAMPADLSTGPDVYLWRVGENKAMRLTQDHRSYFASWALNRIVISRVPGGGTAGPMDATTVVMDLVSGQQRVAVGPRLWLPTVEPAAQYAVAWVGRLRSDGTQVTPRAGGLYLVDWTQIDPFATPSPGSNRPDTTATPDGATPDTATPDTSTPDATASPEPTVTPDATRTPRNRHPSPSAAAPTDAPPTASPTPSDTPSPTDTQPGGGAQSSILQAVDPTRDESGDPVLDWSVRWSADGSTAGVWVADAPGSSWGRLSVFRVTLQAGHFSRDQLLGPRMAGRGFSMGADRVAWVAPSQDNADGELRVRSWDANGYGDLRISSGAAGNGVPSF